MASKGDDETNLSGTRIKQVSFIFQNIYLLNGLGYKVFLNGKHIVLECDMDFVVPFKVAQDYSYH